MTFHKTFLFIFKPKYKEYYPNELFLTCLKETLFQLTISLTKFQINIFRAYIYLYTMIDLQVSFNLSRTTLTIISIISFFKFTQHSTKELTPSAICYSAYLHPQFQLCLNIDLRRILRSPSNLRVAISSSFVIIYLLCQLMVRK